MAHLKRYANGGKGSFDGASGPPANVALKHVDWGSSPFIVWLAKR